MGSAQGHWVENRDTAVGKEEMGEKGCFYY